MALRQRQRNGTNQYHHVKADDIDNDNTLLDEDEQEILIQQIHDEYLQQSERLEKVFTVLCRFIIPVLSFIYTLLLHYQNHESNYRNGNTSKPSHDDKSPYPNRHHHVITLRYIHLILNFIIHWYIPKGVFRKPISPSENTTTTKTTTKTTTTTTSMGGNETTVSLIMWYGVYLPYFLTLLITAIAHWMIRQQKSQLQYAHYGATMEDALSNYFHLTLSISATIFLLSAWYIQHDHHDHIHKIIDDLKLHKYQYKSL
jgi:Trk-type K+ transport system membrane component